METWGADVSGVSPHPTPQIASWCLGTLCTAKKPPYTWASGHFALPKSSPIHGHRDTLHCQKAPLYMGIGTLCIAKKKSPLYRVDVMCSLHRYGGENFQQKKANCMHRILL